MSKIGIFYGSTTGNTEEVANELMASLADKGEVEVVDISQCDANSFAGCDLVLLGTSTWGAGELQDDWQTFIDSTDGVELNGKKVALFGLGDQFGYPDNFVDGMKYIHDFAKSCGGEMVGNWPTDGYEYDESLAEAEGEFIGLVIDNDNQSNMTDARVAEWVEQVISQSGI